MTALCYGRTLARRMPPCDAQTFIDNVRFRRGVGSVTIIVASCEVPGRLDVDAVCHDLSPAQALDALRIASERIRAINGMAPSTVKIVPADETERLREIAMQIVDKVRAFGWWERVWSKAKFFRGSATFRFTREQCVRDVMAALAAGSGTVQMKLEDAA
jgi:hypothetical protein